eukprot:TRINITY_DN21211_c0_g1_i2.p1 TRINITY_DN21211_c0_g1~~TRINITY_DN21211_c0_g1_i2.p1  ORF type:complete len:511 (-),score=131.76 TRINITY_DN21211_c0_g1_i2:477-2009(-)
MNRTLLLEALSGECRRRAREYDPQALSNMVWAYATLSVNDAPLLAAVSGESLVKIPQFASQNLSNTVWAFAKLSVQDYRLLHGIARASISKLSNFLPQEISNTAWAIAKLGFRNGELMEAIAQEAQRDTSRFNPHDLSGIAWAYATLSCVDHKPLLHALCQASMGLLREFNSQDLANTAWSFATLSFTGSGVLDSPTGSEEVVNKIGEFAPQGLATTAWAYTSMGIDNPKLLEAISSEVMRKLHEIEPQSLGILADARLPCSAAVDAALLPVVLRFIEELPTSIAAWEGDGEFPRFLAELRVDNFGAKGARRVFEHMGLAAADEAFARRAMAEVRAVVDEKNGGTIASDAMAGVALVHRRVFAFAEYELFPPVPVGSAVPPPLLRGSLVRENGRRERALPRASGSMLRAVSLPISGLVDRSLCGEFQLLSALLDDAKAAADAAGQPLARLRGTVRLFVSTAPCVSCIGALRQCRLILPETRLEVFNGEDLYLHDRVSGRAAAENAAAASV